MDFSDIINDLKKLEGMQLNSIRPGAEITIASVDLEQKKVQVRSASGKIQSRPFFEFQRIWEALLSSPAIRVEEVLNGSGSSRNQPETIFANLPYIQWLKLGNKKHIAYVGKPTHAFGTLQQMDSMQVAEFTKTEIISNKEMLVLVSTNDIVHTACTIESFVGKMDFITREGHYVYNHSNRSIVLVDSEKSRIACGTYVELARIPFGSENCQITIEGEPWDVIQDQFFKIIVRRPSR